MINLNTAIRYVLGTTEEAVSARKLLEESGFGPKGEHYLFCTKNKAVADGKVFPNATEAIAYLKDTKVEAALYLTDEDQFPRQIPAELTYTGLALRALDWHK